MSLKKEFLIIGFLISIVFIAGCATKTINCNDIQKQIDLCWEKRQPVSEDVIECWRTPFDYKNVCTGLDYTNYYRQYMPCDAISIFYYPPARLIGFEGAEEGLIMSSCPLLT